MKKLSLLIAVLFLFIVFNDYASANTGNAVAGKPMYTKSFATTMPTVAQATSTTMNLTDGDTSTYTALRSGGLIYYVFDEPVTILGAGYNYHSSNTETVNSIIWWYPNGTYGSKNTAGLNNLNIPNVKVFAFRVAVNTRNTTLSEVNIIIDDVGPPPIPTALTATASDKTVRLNWSEVTGVTDFNGYNIYQNGTKINSTPITTASYTANNVANDTEHRWQVSAVRRSIIESAKSAEVVTYFDAVPNAPTNLKATGKEERTELEWTRVTVSDLAGYNVYQNDVKVNSSLVTTNNYTAENVAAGDYRYQVTAVDLGGNESSKSNTATTKVTEKLPSAPSNLKAESVGDVLQVTWNRSVEASVVGYKLYVNNILLTTLSKEALSYDLQGLETGVNYTIGLVAYTELGTNSARSSITAKLLDTIPPAKVLNFIALAGNQAAALYWTANIEKDLAGYHIYVDGSRHSSVSKGSVSALLKNLENDREYQIQISAYDTSANESERSATFLVTPSESADITPPSRPTGLAGVADGKSIVLNWNANTELDLVGYFVYVDNVKVNYAPLESNDFVLSNLDLDTRYRIYVTAIDTSGNESLPSGAITVATAARSAPVGLKATKEEQQVLLTWKAPPSQPDYYIVYKNGIKVAETTELSFSDGALEAGQGYEYEVSAMYSDGESKKAKVGVRMSSGGDIDFGGIGTGININDAVITGVNWLKSFSPWTTIAIGVLIAVVVISFLFLAVRKAKIKNKAAEKLKASETKVERTTREKKVLTDEEKERRARARRIVKTRDDKYDLLTRLGKYEERDAWVKSTDYKTREERKAGKRSSRNYRDGSRTSSVTRTDYKARAARTGRASTR